MATPHFDAEETKKILEVIADDKESDLPSFFRLALRECSRHIFTDRLTPESFLMCYETGVYYLKKRRAIRGRDEEMSRITRRYLPIVAESIFPEDFSNNVIDHLSWMYDDPNYRPQIVETFVEKN